MQWTVKKTCGLKGIVGEKENRARKEGATDPFANAYFKSLEVLNSKQVISRYSSWAYPNTKRKLPRLSCHITECRGKATRGASSEEASYEKLQRMEKTGGRQETNEQDMRTEWSQLTLTKDSKFTLKAAKASRLRV